MLCQQVGLFTEALVAIDGSKFKAVNNRDRNFTQAKMQRRMEEIESSINRYLAAMDSADRQEPAVGQASSLLFEEEGESLLPPHSWSSKECIREISQNEKHQLFRYKSSSKLFGQENFLLRKFHRTAS